MQTASFSGLIETIFYIVAFFYVFKFLARLLLPILVKKVVQKAGENFQQQYQSGSNPHNSSSTEDRTVSGTSKTDKPRETKKVGEYVDYEEID